MKLSRNETSRAAACNLERHSLFRAGALESSPIPVTSMLQRLGALDANEQHLLLVPAAPEVERERDGTLEQLGLV